MSRKIYLGDSVYAHFDGYQIKLTTENGYGASNTIYLDPSVVRSLSEYIDLCYNTAPVETKDE